MRAREQVRGYGIGQGGARGEGMFLPKPRIGLRRSTVAALLRMDTTTPQGSGPKNEG
jgi:hypothetical protein